MDFLSNLSGAGALVTFSALPMLVGLLLPESPFAVRLRQLAIVMALIFPLAFMALTMSIYVSNSGAPAFYDFDVNYKAALALYQNGLSPYTVHAAYSFPFPTFLFYWIMGGLGRLSSVQAWIVSWFVNGLVWIASAIILWRNLLPSNFKISPRGKHLLRYVAVAFPAMATIWEGQTALFILLGLITLHLALGSSNRRDWVGGGVGLGIAILIKPQLVLVGVGLFGFGMLTLLRSGVVENSRDNVIKIMTILGSVAITVLLLIGITLIVPGGISLEIYRDFVSTALPQVARPADGITIGSPSFVAAAIAYQLGAPDRIQDLLANIVTALTLALALFWTYQRRPVPGDPINAERLTEIAAGWAVWAVLAPRIAWTWYAAWCLPFFLLFIREKVSTRANNLWLVALVLSLALLDWQPANLWIAFGTMLLLLVLLWTFGKETPVKI